MADSFHGRSGADPEHINATLNQVFRFLGAPAPDVVIDVRERWNEIVGPVLAEGTEPASIVDGELVITCRDGTWASQVAWMEPQILANFHGLFPSESLVRVSTRTERL